MHVHLALTTHPVGVCTKGVQQELILVPKERGEHHHVQTVSLLSQLCGLGGVVEVIIGHQERLVGADSCCIAADVDQPVDNIPLLQHAGLIGTQLLHQRNRRPAAPTLGNGVWLLREWTWPASDLCRVAVSVAHVDGSDVMVAFRLLLKKTAGSLVTPAFSAPAASCLTTFVPACMS